MRFPEQPSTGPAVVIGTATYAERVEAAASVLGTAWIEHGPAAVRDSARSIVADMLFAAGLRGK